MAKPVIFMSRFRHLLSAYHPKGGGDQVKVTQVIASLKPRFGLLLICSVIVQYFYLKVNKYDLIYL